MANTRRANRRGSPHPLDDGVIVGRISGPWGLDGDLKIEPFTDNPSRFSHGSVLHLEGKPARIERSRKIKGGLVVKLDTVTDRTEAESLRGLFLTVPWSEVVPLPDGTYYYFQLIGTRVWSEDGEYLGLLEEIISTGANDVYVIKNNEQKEILIPALERTVLEVDPGANRMTVRLPDGLR